MQLFKFFHTENTSKQQENGGFCEEMLSENDFEAVLINFCCYEYIIPHEKISEIVPRISGQLVIIF